MAYTTAQLTNMYSNVHAGVVPNATQAGVLAEMAQLSRTGQLSDAQAQYYVVNTADADTAVALQSYQFFTGKTPTQAGVSFLVNSPSNPTDLNDAYYQSFSLENRYINFAQNLGILGEGKANFTATYGALTFAQTVRAVYEQVIGSSYANAAGYNAEAGIADITSRQAYFQQVAAERFGGQDQGLAVKAAVVGYIMAEAIKADVGLYASGVNAFLADLAPDNIAQYNNDLVANYALPNAGLSPAGHVVALTTSFDSPGGSAPAVNTQGRDGDDVFVGNETTLTTDLINGGGGNDRLLLSNQGAGASTATPILLSVERVELSSALGGAMTLDLGNSSGVTSIGLQGGGAGTGPNDVGVGAVSILGGVTGMTITADVDNSVTSGVVAFALKTEGVNDSLNLVLRNTDTGAVATTQGLASLNATGIETLNITSQRAVIASTTVDVNDTLSVGVLVDAAATRLTLAGDSAIALGTTASTLTALATIDASAMTRNVSLGSTTVAFSTAANATITTGSGDDLVSLNVGTTPALGIISLGAAATAQGDTLVLSGSAGAGQTNVDLSSIVDQVTQIAGTANVSSQTGAENIDLRGMSGNAQILGSAGVNRIVATNGSDTVTGGAGGDIIDVLSGFDTLVMSAPGQTGAGTTGNGVLTGVDVVTGMGAGDRVNVTLGAGIFAPGASAEGTAYLSGTSGSAALIAGAYNTTTGEFVSGAAGPDLLFQYDTNGAVAGGTEAIVLMGSNASIASVTSDGLGMFTFT